MVAKPKRILARRKTRECLPRVSIEIAMVHMVF